MRFEAEFKQNEQVWGQAYSRDPVDGVNSIRGNVYFALGDSEPVPLSSLKELHPRLYELLKAKGRELEERFSDAVSFRFQWNDETLVVEEEKPLERGPEASFTIATELVRQGRISRSEALLRVDYREFKRLLCPRFDLADEVRLEERGRLAAVGVGGGGGAVSGRLVLSAERALALHSEGQTPVLAVDRLGYAEREVLPLLGGVLIRRGSLGAARQFERPCVLVENAVVGHEHWSVDGVSLKEGSWVSLDGYSGKVFSAALPVNPGTLTDEASTLLQWADEVKRIELRANVTNSEEVAQGVHYGAQGVGLCRIDYTFLSQGRLKLFQSALREICEQGIESSPTIDSLTNEVEGEIRAMMRELPKGNETPFALRLLDFPLAMLLREWSDSSELDSDYFTGLLGDWRRELNPLQGLRCGRLAVAYPALMKLQLRAALRAWKRVGIKMVRLQLMLAGTSDPREVELFGTRIDEACREEGVPRPGVGTMLEVPRACLLAAEMGRYSDFCSFGTGDLTESTCSLSRYDSQLSFLPAYLEQGVFDEDPFLSIDRKGVGQLMRLATEQLKEACPEVELGTCGAQAVQPDSLSFCLELGLKYVSAPPKMIPILRLLGAQLALREPLP